MSIHVSTYKGIAFMGKNLVWFFFVTLTKSSEEFMTILLNAVFEIVSEITNQ